MLACARMTLCAQVPGTLFYDVTTYGARADSTHISTLAIQKAIDAAEKAGGGYVFLPNGKYTTGKLILKTGVYLYLAPGAVLYGSTKPEDYGTSDRHLITAYGAQRTGILGHGRINGNGSVFWDANYAPLPTRPMHWITFYDCRNLTVRDVTLEHAPGWVLDLTRCEDAVIDGIRILNHPRSPNTDGIDLVGSRHVRISNCYIETGDDAICLKTANNEPDTNPIEFITVTNCVIQSDDAGLKLGTGSGRVTRYCTFSNIIIRNTRFGIALFMKDGGTFSDINFSGIQMEMSSRHQTEYPIYIDLDQRNDTVPLGRIQNIVFDNIQYTSRGNILIAGHPRQPIEGLVLRNLRGTVVNPISLEGMVKPKGAREVKHAGHDYAPQQANLTLAHIRKLRLEGLELVPVGTGATRQLLFEKDVTRTAP